MGMGNVRCLRPGDCENHIEANKRIVIEWLGYSGLTTVEWIFASQKDGTTFVSITETSIGSSGS